MGEAFLRSFIIGFSGAMMPGSLLTYTIDKSIKGGAKAGLIISLGHSLLELLLVFLMFLGLAPYLGTWLARIIIGTVGGAVLIFFGVSMLKDIYLNRLSINFEGSADGKYGNLLIGGAVISASNPYFIVWWAAVGLGLVMNAYNTFGILGVAVVYIGHILADITWYCFVSTLISKTRAFINLKVYKIIIAVLGTCLIGFGVSFIYASVRFIL